MGGVSLYDDSQESKFIWMRFLNSDQPADFGTKSIIAEKADIP